MESTPGLYISIVIMTVLFVIFLFFIFIFGFTRGFRVLDRALGRHDIDKEFEMDSKRNK